jgi:hypothetical protein
VIAPPLRAALDAVRRWLAGHDEIHSIDLRVSSLDGRGQLVLAAHGDVRGGIRGLQALLRATPGLASIAVSQADPEKKRVLGRKPKVVLGDAALEEGIGAARYRLHPGAFFQADPQNAAQIHDLVREGVGTAATLLDLYAGVGAYAIALAPGRKRVVAVEEVPQAAEAARAMAPPNVEVVAMSVEDLTLDQPFDAAILNPARRGSDPATLRRLAKVARRLVYVSCGPEALARDLDALAAYGMRVVSLVPVDLFPQTDEVETVVVLERGPPLEAWPLPSGGRARGPWAGRPSGVVGPSTEAIALVLGDPGAKGTVPGGRFERIGMVATHGLIRIVAEGEVRPVLSALGKRGHPTIGQDPKTNRFFVEKAGLVRPFVHISRSGRIQAPLHGDLAHALVTLRASPDILRKVGVSAGFRGVKNADLS